MQNRNCTSLCICLKPSANWRNVRWCRSFDLKHMRQIQNSKWQEKKEHTIPVKLELHATSPFSPSSTQIRSAPDNVHRSSHGPSRASGKSSGSSMLRKAVCSTRLHVGKGCDSCGGSRSSSAAQLGKMSKSSSVNMYPRNPRLR